MKNIPLLLILTWLTYGGLFAQHPVVPVATLPFEIARHHVVIHAEINGKTMPYVLDTRTRDMYLYQWAIDSLDLDMKPKDKYEGGRDSLIIGKARPGRLYVANTHFDPGQIWCYQNTPYFNYLGKKVAGMIGSSLFDKFVVHFDFDKDTLSLYDPKTFTPGKDMKMVPLKKRRGGVLARMTFKFPDGQVEKYHVMLSTGTDKTVMGKYKIGKRHGYFKRGYPRHRDVGMELPGHFFKASKSYQTKMGFLGDIFTNVPVTISHEEKTFAQQYWFDHMMVGTDFLSKYNITFDYNKRKAYFQENTHFSTTFSKNKSGLIFRKSFQDDQYIVHYVMPNAPAREAGVQKGDVLVSIYKEPANNFTLEEIERLLMENYNKVELHLKRDGVIYRKLFRLADF